MNHGFPSRPAWRLLGAVIILVASFPVLCADGGSEAFTKAEEFYKNAKFEMALLFYNKELSQNPGNAAAYFHRGRILIYNRDFAAAADDLRKAAEIDPKNPDIVYFRGIAATGRTDGPSAVAAFAEVPKKSRFYPDSFLYGGMVYWQLMRDATNTIRCYETYLVLKPDNDQAGNIRRQIECLRNPDCLAQAIAELNARNTGASLAGGPATNAAGQTGNTNQLKLEDLFMPDNQGEATKADVSKQKASEGKKSIQTE